MSAPTGLATFLGLVRMGRKSKFSPLLVVVIVVGCYCCCIASNHQSFPGAKDMRSEVWLLLGEVVFSIQNNSPIHNVLYLYFVTTRVPIK
ncbi:hypothetical protein BC937DRAFT_93461 [Endogone sp. FLAS-F59071]|nr:hypothetical protein BC937DRAFT_93461 [Endogone sp. FLAS-F59071]|eukprot:RUS14702.1 hypothetical protein BC937DRAFT_93461 [Endogone sp. FLAS-F59071]